MYRRLKMLLKKGVRLHRKHATVITPNLLFTLIALIVMPLVLEFSHFIYLDVLEKYFSQFIKGYDQADNLIFKNSVTASQYYLYYNLFFLSTSSCIHTNSNCISTLSIYILD